MKKLLTLIFIASAFLMLQCSDKATKSEMSSSTVKLEKGTSVYACACGPSCKCNSISMKPGNCTCGTKLTKATVVSNDGNEVVLDINGKNQTMKAKPKYKCGCGPSCTCGFISDNPGKCVCGADLIEAK